MFCVLNNHEETFFQFKWDMELSSRKVIFQKYITCGKIMKLVNNNYIQRQYSYFKHISMSIFLKINQCCSYHWAFNVLKVILIKYMFIDIRGYQIFVTLITCLNFYTLSIILGLHVIPIKHVFHNNRSFVDVRVSNYSSFMPRVMLLLNVRQNLNWHV